MRAAFVDQNQLYEIEQIRRCFLENGVDFMLLKGVWLKPLYPQSDLRPMGDVDILIKNEQYDIIRPLMLQMGYREILESDHELIWDKPGVLHVELHKRLIPSYNKDYYAYFGDGWRLAQPTAGSEHDMRAEDQFVYLFTHYAKHYRDAGIGIRHLMDLHVFLKAKPDLDRHYMETELEKLQLLTFCRHSLETLAVIAYNQPVTRAYIDQVRGVDSAYSLGVLADRELITEMGRMDVPGRPRLYGTTEVFLRVFGLSDISELPPLALAGGEGV
jgi:segregation and condensation protein B